MRKNFMVRIWGALEALAFFGIYCTAVYIARFLLYVFFAVYYAIVGYIDHALFDAVRFSEEVNHAIAASRVEIVILADIIMILLCAVVIFARGGSFRKYVGLERTNVLQIIGALVAGAAVWYVSITLLSDLLAGTSALKNYTHHVGKLNQAHPYVTFALTVLVAPFTEELMFRGALFNSVTRFLNKPLAVIITSLLFAIAHGDPVQMGYAFVLGVMLSFIRAETGKLYPCIAMHFAFNLMNYFISGYVMPLWIAIVISCIGYGLALYKKA
ncbi:MAG: CPBP family intramembrane metalloprotease [Clostridia bacterium]|nr:CPBP family intramembrane metalloprotease [Clostridia bacterium]